MFNQKHWQNVVAIMALVLALAVPASVGLAQGSLGNPRVLPPGSHPYGMTYAQWGARWWQWAMSIPYSTNPVINDQTGAYCDVGQSGPVWFLAGTSGDAVTRSCTIPAGKAIFFPIVNLNNDYPCPDPSFQPSPGQSLEDFLTNGNDTWPGVRNYIDLATELHVSVDGVPLQNLFDYRATSSLFTFTGDPSLTATWDPCTTGTPQVGVSDGYWIMLAPLTPGNHTIHFDAYGLWFVPDATYNLKVKP